MRRNQRLQYKKHKTFFIPVALEPSRCKEKKCVFFCSERRCRELVTFVYKLDSNTFFFVFLSKKFKGTTVMEW